MSPRPLVIGIGNPDRGDDAVGWLVIDQLAVLAGEKDQAIDVQKSGGDVGELLESFGSRDVVILVDAAFSSERSARDQSDPASHGGGGFFRWDASSQPLNVTLSGASSHVLGLGESLELARALGQLPKKTVIYGIYGQRYELGAPVSRGVLTVIPEVVAQIQAEFAR